MSDAKIVVTKENWKDVVFDLDYSVTGKTRATDKLGDVVVGRKFNIAIAVDCTAEDMVKTFLRHSAPIRTRAMLKRGVESYPDKATFKGTDAEYNDAYDVWFQSAQDCDKMLAELETAGVYNVSATDLLITEGKGKIESAEKKIMRIGMGLVKAGADKLKVMDAMTDASTGNMTKLNELDKKYLQK